MATNADTLRDLGIIMPKRDTPPSTPPEKTPVYSENKHKLDDMKTELELQRLEYEKRKLAIDLDKLAKPDTNIDYYSKMLEMQQQFNNQILSMQKQNFDTQLELAKLQLGQEGETEKWLGFLEPYLPTLIGRFAGMGGGSAGSAEQPVYVNDEHGNMIPNPNLYKKLDNPLMDTGADKPLLSVSSVGNASSSQSAPVNDYDMNVKQYQQEIKEGKISLEQAWNDWQAIKPQLPRYLASMTYEEFKAQYEQIRAQGK